MGEAFRCGLGATSARDETAGKRMPDSRCLSWKARLSDVSGSSLMALLQVPWSPFGGWAYRGCCFARLQPDPPPGLRSRRRDTGVVFTGPRAFGGRSSPGVSHLAVIPANRVEQAGVPGMRPAVETRARTTLPGACRWSVPVRLEKPAPQGTVCKTLARSSPSASRLMGRSAPTPLSNTAPFTRLFRRFHSSARQCYRGARQSLGSVPG
jgi:hypothetical protein